MLWLLHFALLVALSQLVSRRAGDLLGLFLCDPAGLLLCKFLLIDAFHALRLDIKLIKDFIRRKGVPGVALGINFRLLVLRHIELIAKRCLYEW